MTSVTCSYPSKCGTKCESLFQVRSHSENLLRTWHLRDLLTIKNTPSSITVLSETDGAILWQNAASMAMFGESKRKMFFAFENLKEDPPLSCPCNVLIYPTP